MDIDQLRETLKVDEGVKNEIYLDHLGLPTCGIGHLITEDDPEHGLEVGTHIDDERVNELEKCVILLQMFTFVGNDIYDENINYYPGRCNRSDAENFLIENASFIEY